MLFLLFICSLYSYVIGYNTFNIHIFKTPVFKHFPNLKLHHFILINDFTSDMLYAIDFTPKKDINSKSLFQMILGKNVPAEIRLRKLKFKHLYDKEKIISVWNNINSVNKNLSVELTQLVLTSIQNEEIKYYIQDILKWKYTDLHLYFHNCQHFSKFCYDLFVEDYEYDQCEKDSCDL